MASTKIQELQKKKKASKLTYEEIAQKSGVSLSSVQKILGGKVESPRYSTIEAIENVLMEDTPTYGKISIGNQDFATIIESNYFYVDKTSFIKKWWENADVVTLITRPRRFGKTLNLSMLDHFFSNKYQNGSQLFSKLSIWDSPSYRKLCNQYPVLFISFASVKGKNYETAREQIIQTLVALYRDNMHLMDAPSVTDLDLQFWNKIGYDMSDATAAESIRFLCELMYKYYGKKAIVLLDEYDTPIHEAYVDGFWNEMTGFIRSLFNSTFKTNPYLERAIMTGITRVSKESIFSDLNNLKVDTMINASYDTDFGFTEEEVRHELSRHGLGSAFPLVKEWYDGFRIGNARDIYNPWSVTQYLDSGVLNNYWANTSENSLVEKLIREGSVDVKRAMESLLNGESIEALIDEEVVFNLIDKNESGIFSMLLASGYLKIDSDVGDLGIRRRYMVSLTNLEVRHAFENMIKRWFEGSDIKYNDFIKALLLNDVKYMNRFMNEVALNTFSIFDVGGRASEKYEPERFYHGFILGLMVDLADRYIITSNRESGFGRYDVCLEPRVNGLPAYVLEFKVHDPDDEKDLADTVQKALEQIKEKKYDAQLIANGISKKDIHHYGFAFEGKKVLIG
ncbi:PD-(D/E)XK nuclease superfamily protein [Butyrivibrio sp. INlla18]|uniref:AAA family ATPase n=1 Tax=Butyrivibrio sp. INlla18 TaxID=1520806 RepID=UPI000881F460|nr:AAA family ATPase [Butyrivibrio sp. INlla18]SDA73395.1 PD-(D/E)XK nuclease superfamily protein [Butyrivibrio sp. INlla18]